MSLGIEQVIITDNIAERAKTCTTVLAPTTRVGAPIGEFQFAGDTQALSGSNLRPNGATLDVLAGYGSVPLHTVFSGNIEVMDDLEDADQYNYSIILSAIPASQNHRTKLTLMYNLLHNSSKVTANTNTHKILRDACSAAGIPFGRCDLPLVKVYGDYEIIRRNICEIAEDLCAPFNQFDYKHYYVRVSERDGLSIIGIDYSLGGEVDNLYEVVNVKQKTRSFERYMPDNRIGTSDVLLVGADIYSDDANSATTITSWDTVYHTYHSDSRDNDEVGNDQWTETDTNVTFIIEVTSIEGKIYTGGNDIDDYIAALAAGEIGNISIVESYTTSTVTDSYDDIDGRTQRVETWYSYEQKRFPLHVYKAGERIAHVLAYDETLTTIYPDASDFEQTLVKNWYGYSDSGVQNSTVTRTYYNEGRDTWVLESMHCEASESTGLTNALIQFYVDKANKGPDYVFLGEYAKVNAAAVIGKYKLLNGVSISINKPPTRRIIDNTLKGYDPTAAQFEEEQREKRCFQMSTPYMDIDGLNKLWDMCQRQKVLENAGAYWEVVKATSSIDTSPAAGESIIVSGSSGICDTVEHAITGDSAITTLSVRRLITP
jgi:hypothetical protein